MADKKFQSRSEYSLFNDTHLSTLKKAAGKLKIELILNTINGLANDLAMVLLLPRKFHKSLPPFNYLNGDSSAAFDRALFLRKLPTLARFAFVYAPDSAHSAVADLLLFSLSLSTNEPDSNP